MVGVVGGEGPPPVRFQSYEPELTRGACGLGAKNGWKQEIKQTGPGATKQKNEPDRRSSFISLSRTRRDARFSLQFKGVLHVDPKDQPGLRNMGFS